MFNIALYQPDIPQNTAAIIRLCSCFDATLEIIEPCGFYIEDKRIKKVAMDYLDKIKIIKHKSYDDFLIKKKNSRIILMTTKAKKKYYNFKFKFQATLLFGRESAGVPKKVHNYVDEQITIPMVKGLRSINVSSAVAIVVGEAYRQLNLF